jgi:hypothetical protein
MPNDHATITTKDAICLHCPIYPHSAKLTLGEFSFIKKYSESMVFIHSYTGLRGGGDYSHPHLVRNVPTHMAEFLYEDYVIYLIS